MANNDHLWFGFLVTYAISSCCLKCVYSANTSGLCDRNHFPYLLSYLFKLSKNLLKCLNSKDWKVLVLRKLRFPCKHNFLCHNKNTTNLVFFSSKHTSGSFANTQGGNKVQLSQIKTIRVKRWKPCNLHHGRRCTFYFDHSQVFRS